MIIIKYYFIIIINLIYYFKFYLQFHLLIMKLKSILHFNLMLKYFKFDFILYYHFLLIFIILKIQLLIFFNQIKLLKFNFNKYLYPN